MDGSTDVVPALIEAGATQAAPGEQDLRVVMDSLHPELAGRSTRSVHHEVDGASHLTLLTDADHARSTARLVTELVDGIGP